MAYNFGVFSIKYNLSSEQCLLLSLYKNRNPDPDPFGMSRSYFQDLQLFLNHSYTACPFCLIELATDHKIGYFDAGFRVYYLYCARNVFYRLRNLFCGSCGNSIGLEYSDLYERRSTRMAVLSNLKFIIHKPRYGFVLSERYHNKRRFSI